MVKIKFEFRDNEQLKKLIEDAYMKFNGKRNDTDEYITLSDDDIYYNILLGMDYDIKITNDELISGCIRVKKVEEGSSIRLYPISRYCIIDESDKFSFY